MGSSQVWITGGNIDVENRKSGADASDGDMRRFAKGDVRLTTGHSGIEVKWATDSPCYAALYRAMEMFGEAASPIILRFHAMGWFEEMFSTAPDAIRRIETILTRGDRYFTSRAFVKEGELNDDKMPAVLRESLERQAAPDEYCVECAFDQSSHKYVVDRIGEKSAIGRLWGTYTSSFPCVSRSRYGDAVSAAYDNVLREGRPHYDQVLAAMRLPDNEVHWVPYHRVIFPSTRRQGLAAVSIVSVIANVGFSVI